MASPIRIALINQDDASSIRAWSGTHYFSTKAIERYVGNVTNLSPVRRNVWLLRALRKTINLITGKRYSYDHDPFFARRYGRYFAKLLKQGEYDLIYAPAATASIAYLETDIPIIHFSDATWAVMQNYYFGYANCLQCISQGGHELERRSLEKADLALLSSEWAASSAIEEYGTDPEKVYIVYIGANLLNPPAREEVLPRKLGKKIRLLLVGVSWEVKGGKIAYETLLSLLEQGYDAELTLLGCEAPPQFNHPVYSYSFP